MCGLEGPGPGWGYTEQVEASLCKDSCADLWECARRVQTIFGLRAGRQPPRPVTLHSAHTHTKPSSGQTQQSPLWSMWTLTATTVFSPLNISAPAQILQCVWHWLLCLASLCVIFAPVPSINRATYSFSWGKKSAYEPHSSMSQMTWALMAHLMQHYCVTAVVNVFPLFVVMTTWMGFREILKESNQRLNKLQICTFKHSILGIWLPINQRAKLQTFLCCITVDQCRF